MLLNNKKASDFIYLQPDKDYIIKVFASDPNQYTMTARWELLPESTDLKNGGDRESRPQAIPASIVAKDLHDVVLKTPKMEGPYRLFLYLSDGHNKVATANIPFYVKSE